jgi:hypothetical protein
MGQTYALVKQCGIAGMAVGAVPLATGSTHSNCGRRADHQTKSLSSIWAIANAISSFGGADNRQDPHSRCISRTRFRAMSPRSRDSYAWGKLTKWPSAIRGARLQSVIVCLAKDSDSQRALQHTLTLADAVSIIYDRCAPSSRTTVALMRVQGSA